MVLQLASQLLIQTAGLEPAFAAPAEEIANFFQNRNLSLTPFANLLSLLSFIAFFWFLGVLWAALQRHEGEAPWLSLVACASGIAGMSIPLSSGGWELALLRLRDGQPAPTVQLLFDQGIFAFSSHWVAMFWVLASIALIRRAPFAVD